VVEPQKETKLLRSLLEDREDASPCRFEEELQFKDKCGGNRNGF
jgi:hypothetical protein